MEWIIPAIHGPGASRPYFVDRHREFSIYDIDFVPTPTVDLHPAPWGSHCAECAQGSAPWLSDTALRRVSPLPGQLRLREARPVRC